MGKGNSGEVKIWHFVQTTQTITIPTAMASRNTTTTVNKNTTVNKRIKKTDVLGCRPEVGL